MLPWTLMPALACLGLVFIRLNTAGTCNGTLTLALAPLPCKGLRKMKSSLAGEDTGDGDGDGDGDEKSVLFKVGSTFSASLSRSPLVTRWRLKLGLIILPVMVLIFIGDSDSDCYCYCCDCTDCCEVVGEKGVLVIQSCCVFGLKMGVLVALLVIGR